MWIHRNPLALIVITDRMPARFGGYTIGPVVLIRPRAEHDRGLLEHELTHVRQLYRTLGLLPLLAALSKRWRLKMEVEAYRQQLIFSPGREQRFAEFLATKYGLNISVDKAVQLLKA